MPTVMMAEAAAEHDEDEHHDRRHEQRQLSSGEPREPPRPGLACPWPPSSRIARRRGQWTYVYLGPGPSAPDRGPGRAEGSVHHPIPGRAGIRPEETVMTNPISRPAAPGRPLERHPPLARDARLARVRRPRRRGWRSPYPPTRPTTPTTGWASPARPTASSTRRGSTSPRPRACSSPLRTAVTLPAAEAERRRGRSGGRARRAPRASTRWPSRGGARTGPRCSSPPSWRADQEEVAALQDVTERVAASTRSWRSARPATCRWTRRIGEQVADDLSAAEGISLPVTLVLMLIAFGALIAAGIPVLLAATSVAATIGITAPLSHLVHAEPTVSSMIVLIGMAVGVDYSLFYLKREREERARGAHHPRRRRDRRGHVRPLHRRLGPRGHRRR